MRFQLDLAVSTPKNLVEPDSNEDAWAVDIDRGCVAISDGASISYDSRTWARLLVERYVCDNSVNEVWVASAVNEYTVTANVEALPWYQQGAFEQGSFATLVGAELAPNGTDLEIVAVGDSLALHLRNGQMLAAFPFTEAEQFDADPMLLSTVHHANHFVGAPDFFKQHSAPTWEVREGDVLMLVTDAVGRWLLTAPAPDEPPRSQTLLAVADATEFEKLILRLRSEKLIKLDDSTMLRIQLLK
jgi:hypothetical protein